MSQVYNLAKANNLADYEAILKTLEFVHRGLAKIANMELEKLVKDAGNMTPNDLQIQLSKVKEMCSNLQLAASNTLAPQKNPDSKIGHTFTDDIQKRIQVETILHTLATTTSAESSDNFFRFCLKNLADLYQCKFAFISLLSEDKETATTVAVWADTQFIGNFTYAMHGTPCADIANFSKELIPDNACVLYAEDEMLVQMGVQSYFGAPLVSIEKGVIGVVSVMDTKPMYPNEWTAPVLGTFASRISLEVQRNQAFENIRRLNESLEQRIGERTHELEERNKELSTFTYTVSHDLRAPVRAIRSFTQILQEDEASNMSIEGREHLRRIIKAGEKMDHMIEDLLLLSRMRDVVLFPTKVNLTDLYIEEMSILKAQEPGRKLLAVIAPDMTVSADKGLMQLVVQNLLGNAWKYTQGKDNASITIGQFEEEGEKIFYIKDTGAGFDMSYSDKLFRPFQRLHSENVFKGNGVGLATVFRIIEKHHGRIWARAKVNEGATFYFTIPQANSI